MHKHTFVIVFLVAVLLLSMAQAADPIIPTKVQRRYSQEEPPPYGITKLSQRIHKRTLDPDNPPVYGWQPVRRGYVDNMMYYWWPFQTPVFFQNHDAWRRLKSEAYDNRIFYSQGRWIAWSPEGQIVRNRELRETIRSQLASRRHAAYYPKEAPDAQRLLGRYPDVYFREGEEYKYVR